MKNKRTKLKRKKRTKLKGIFVLVFAMSLLVGLGVAGPLTTGKVFGRNENNVLKYKKLLKLKKVNGTIDFEKLKEKIPDTYDFTLKKVNAEETKTRKFLMWTRGGEHIMWGRLGNRYFIGKDNLEKKAWGIYGRTYFAGFYNGSFFYGRYRRGHWKAHNLFDKEHLGGRYVLFY